MSPKPGEFTDAEEPRSRPAYRSRCRALPFLLLFRNAVVVQEILASPLIILRANQKVGIPGPLNSCCSARPEAKQ
ncbi:hypothetical protein MUG91_G68n51 [Manis pentadactyla]|nr:hypothetical protein MUG91_G68n51 [Manis pentadactyla]